MAGVAVLEWPAMRDNGALQLIVDKPFWYFAAAAMGFCVNLLAYMVIQTASSLTLKVIITDAITALWSRNMAHGDGMRIVAHDSVWAGV